jgi:predicted RNA-binding Zn-ribbon protein involved in translation (DUF1610 family)
MIQCPNCGQSNYEQSQFCRFCGTKFLAQQQFPESDYDYQARQPYSWKTDEYQTKSEPRKKASINQVEQLNAPLSAQNYNAQPLAYHGPLSIDPNYRCPNCMSQFLPRTERRISTAGWITFAALLIVFFPLFWIGLLIKEDVKICPSCGSKIR